MKPEIGYPRIVVGSYIDDLIRDIEYNMKLVTMNDPYFEQLSVEKFTFETLLQEIAERDDITPTEILEQFAKRAEQWAAENQNPSRNYTFSVSRDAALSILDGLNCGFLEGERRGGF